MLVAAPCLGVDFFVTSNGDQGDGNPGNGLCSTPGPGVAACTLRAAVEEANALPGRDRIFFNGPGTIGVGETLTLAESVSLFGNGATLDGSGTVVTGNGTGRLFDVLSGAGVVFRDLVLSNSVSDGSYGAAIRSTGGLELYSVYLVGNEASSCGAVEIDGPSNLIVDSTFDSNQATGDPGLGGALCIRSGSVSVHRTTFAHNRARRGAAISIDSGAFVNLDSSPSLTTTICCRTGCLLPAPFGRRARICSSTRR